jgi:hypothetical protein
MRNPLQPQFPCKTQFLSRFSRVGRTSAGMCLKTSRFSRVGGTSAGMCLKTSPGSANDHTATDQSITTTFASSIRIRSA